MKNKSTGSWTRSVWVYVSCFLLLASMAQAQTDSAEKAHEKDFNNLPYYFNFDYKRDKCAKRITFEALPINLPYSYFKNAFPFSQDSSYSVQISEEEKESYSIKHRVYRLTLCITFNWDDDYMKRGLMTSYATAGIGILAIANKRWREVPFEELDSLVDHDDSLRYKIHSVLRKRHEDYLLKRTGIDFNIARFLEKVAEIRLIDSDMWVEKADSKYIRKMIYANDTVTVYSKLLIKVKEEMQPELLALLGKDSELMSSFGTIAYHYDYDFLLSDKDNNYLGRISVSGCGGNRVLLAITDSYTYKNDSVPYKNCERINELIETMVKEKNKKKK